MMVMMSLSHGDNFFVIVVSLRGLGAETHGVGGDESATSCRGLVGHGDGFAAAVVLIDL